MNVEKYEESGLLQKISRLKLSMISLAISLFVLSVILLPLGFLVNQNIHLYGWIPVVSLIVIVLDVFIFRYIFLKNKLKEAKSVRYLGKKTNLTVVLIFLFALLLIYDFIITIMKTVGSYLFPDNFFYGYICAIIILAIALFITSTDFSEVQVDSIVAGFLLIFYAILLSPQILSKFASQVYPYLPFNLALRSLLTLGLTLVYFVFQGMRKTRILPLMLIYAWIFIPFQIINWFGFTNYYSFEATINLFYTNPVLLRMIQTSSIVIASCMLVMVTTFVLFATKLLVSNSQSKNIPNE
ncbi:MAG: hypothetical protein H7645_11065 [Candidatus Heimdallarchaeota archaeon]|nr:hypothetical protein [Candidatus Heimdallarchaeota archaeon]MCK4770865.1 hypothetical protein [Candidatus Heimdallarchaeota archaeon]